MNSLSKRSLEARLQALEAVSRSSGEAAQIDTSRLANEELNRLNEICERIGNGTPIASLTTDELRFVVNLPRVGVRS